MIKWEKPWKWSPRTRRATVGKLVDVYIHPAMGGGYFATLNGRHLEQNFGNLREAKRVMEAKIIRMLKYALRKAEIK